MKKAGLNMEKNNDLLLFIFIAVIILIFITFFQIKNLELKNIVIRSFIFLMKKY